MGHVLLINFFFIPPPLLFHPFFLIRSLNSHDYSYQVFFGGKSCCFSVSAIVTSAFMYVGITHRLSTFPLHLCDMRLSPITPSTLPQAFAPAAILIVTKAIN